MRQHAEDAALRANPCIARSARAGYVAKGVIYATIGVLAMREALGLGGVLLLILAAGLVGYALWKLVQGIMDPDQKGSAPTACCAALATSGAA